MNLHTTHRSRNRRWLPLLASACVTLLATLPADAMEVTTPRQQADRIYAETGVTGGVVVDLGCGDGKLTAALHASDSYLVQGLDVSPENVHNARATVNQAGLYGKVSVSLLAGARLPYVDNLVNLIVVQQLGKVPQSELLRVLSPHGVAYVNNRGRWTKIVKPRPSEIDDWTHYLHDASNNAVAHDTVVGPPRRLQWTDGPRYARHHDRMSSVSAVVSANGRVFSIEDEQSPISILLPSKWVLTARDAFNGTTLWKRPIKKWFTQFWPLKSGPAQLPRRLVAVGDRVYVTLGFEAPLVALDAATGETVRAFANTHGTEEAILADGSLYLLVQPTLDASQYDDPKRFNKGYGAKFWDEKPRHLMAYEAATAKLLWDRETVVLPATLAANDQCVVFHNGVNVVCLDRESGEELWKSAPIDRAKEIKSFYLPILVLYQDVVLFSGGETAGLQTGSWYEKGKDTMTALDLATGKILWTAPHPPSGYRSPEDLLVANGLVWTGETTSGRAVGQFTGRNPRTGKVVSRFEPDVSTYWFHHRCYRGKATDNYLLMARAGTEFIDIENQHWDINHWIRGACLYGIMPANGLLYAPRHPCACYLETKMSGFNALAPESKGPRIAAPRSDDQRLLRGPAYAEMAEARPSTAASNSEDWPTFRHDSGRTGHATTALANKLVPDWSTTLGGKLTSPVVDDGRLFVASVEDHVLHVLDANNGKRLWQFQASGRIDSPPTVHAGRAIFGSADGNVYCLRATDGALVWQFLAAPMSEQLVSYGQLESVWPVHGSPMIENDVLYFVAGRSLFVDDGMLFWRLDPLTGKVLSKTPLKEFDTNGKSIQDYVSWLNMPTALPDVLSTDGRFVYMRSQPFRLDGTRLPLQAMPRKADADRGAPEPFQIAEHAHLFSPTGFLDDTWWHRTYWLYGSTFISGWSGYYLSGKVAPAGRLLVTDDSHVFGFGRKPKYFRWTVPIEHQLFSAQKTLEPTLSPPRKGPSESRVSVKKSASLNPANRPLTVEARIKADHSTGVILAHGGNSAGYALFLDQGRPTFAIRAAGALSQVQAKNRIANQWTHLAGVLTEDKVLKIYVNGILVGTEQAAALIPGNPAEGMEIGADEGSNVGDYVDRFGFSGLIDEVRVFHRARTNDEILESLTSAVASAKPVAMKREPTLVLAYNFDQGKATDLSGMGNQGIIDGAKLEEGNTKAVRFFGGGLRIAGYKVKHNWTEDLPFFARAMVLAKGTLLLAGPPDLINEETAFRRISDPKTQERLREQLESVEGKKGAILWAVTAADGTKIAQYKLKTPPVFDGMIAANGRLYIITVDGQVVCWK